MARLYSNENFPLPAVKELRSLGHDVLTSFEAGKANSAVPDDEVLAFAVAEDRILLSMNRLHFLRLHRQTSAHAGMVLCTFDADFTALARRIDAAIRSVGGVRNQVIRVNREA